MTQSMGLRACAAGGSMRRLHQEQWPLLNRCCQISTSMESSHAIYFPLFAGDGRLIVRCGDNRRRSEQYLACRRRHPEYPAVDFAEYKTASAPDVQRGKIKQVLSGEDTEVTFSLKATQSARSFNPAVGATIPPSLKAHALPPPLIYEMPNLKRYTYLKFKGQVLIVNPMNRKIVDMFSET